ncbi:MAG: RNA methyltransferase [Ferruginibacter sp.]
MQVPPSLINSLAGLKGFNEEAFKRVHSSGRQVTSIRFNPAKLNGGSAATLFDGNLDGKIPWSSNGYYLTSRPSFTLDPLFHAGAYYVQEASSMFLEEAIKQMADLTKPLRILDLCAAPGGKSTLIQSVISEKSLLVSNEVIKTRVNVLTENITRWGGSNVIVTNNYPKDFQRMPEFFDLVIVDAPCSGSGLFRKDPKAINEWSEQQVEQCSRRQQSILADILPALKEGGLLIYSTCSFSKEENEEICDWFIKNYRLSSVSYQIRPEWNIIETVSPEKNAYGYRFYPDKLKGEGFFIAAFKKEKLDNEFRKEATAKGGSEKVTSKEIEVAKPWLKSGGDFFLIKHNEELFAIPIHLEKDLMVIRSVLYIKKAGVKLGTIIRDELIPAHELALSTIISPFIPAIVIDKETALQYLRRQEIKVDSDSKGWALLSHRQLNLGWIKALTNRVNNYYPKSWRILNK